MKYTLFFLILFISSTLSAQPSIKWQKCLGGTGNDFPGGMIQTSDGGYLMTGSTHSSDGDITLTHGNYDLWILKLNKVGAIEWQKTYGGSQDENGGAMIEALDGGYIITGTTNSIDGDLKGLRTDTTQSDIWIFKIDTLGNIQWQKIYGGTKEEYPSSIVNGGEGEYIVSAVTTSGDGDVKGFHGGSGGDIWILGIDEKGAMLWQKIFGGSNDDAGAILPAPSGYMIIGNTSSTDGDITGRVRDSSSEVWLAKLDFNTNIIWQKTYGGSAYDAGNDAIPTLDHGYAIAGWTSSDNNGDVSGIHQAAYFGDTWIIKTDSIGNIEWQKCLGGSQGDYAYSILQTPDSGYIVSASTASGDGDVIGNHDGGDCWVFKLSKSGNLLWQKPLGGSASDANIGSGIMPTADSGFLVVTMTWSNDGDVSGLHGDSNNADIWLVKLSPEPKPSAVQNIGDQNSEYLSAYPNPSSGRSTISYTLDKPSDVKIEIYNPLGEKLRTYINTKEVIGNHEHEFDISDFPSGSYFIKIEIGGKSEIKSIVLMR